MGQTTLSSNAAEALGLAAAFFGMPVALALLADATALLALPVILPSLALAWVVALQLRATRGAWGLLRGGRSVSRV